ncbi:hypothetical protein [Deinococcus altitudinis]|uniref:hypothetical protein n=1 Tax=Deinococcus altitudinis TaxID=468914 RepID=UPI003891C26C
MHSVTRHLRRPLSRLLLGDIYVPDRCWDSRRTSRSRAYQARSTIARVLAAGYVDGWVQLCSLLIEYIDLQDSNVWLPASNREVRSILAELMDLLRKRSGRPRLPILLNLERRSGRGRTLHSHGIAPLWVGKLVKAYLGEKTVLTLPSGRRVRIGNVRPLIGADVGKTWTYMTKCADASAVHRKGQTHEEWTKDVQQAIERSQEAEAARKAEQLYRLPSTRIRIDLPKIRLAERQYQALARILSGEAPVIPAPTFVVYLDRVANQLVANRLEAPHARRHQEHLTLEFQVHGTERPEEHRTWKLPKAGKALVNGLKPLRKPKRAARKKKKKARKVQQARNLMLKERKGGRKRKRPARKRSVKRQSAAQAPGGVLRLVSSVVVCVQSVLASWRQWLVAPLLLAALSFVIVVHRLGLADGPEPTLTPRGSARSGRARHRGTRAREPP